MVNRKQVKRLLHWTSSVLRNLGLLARDITQKQALIFVSYRRADSGWAANYLVQELQSHFDVFQDIKMKRGSSFREQIETALDRCDVFLALIGIEWLKMTNNGLRRIDDPADVVRIEIETALSRNLPILLILVGGASRPTPADLPESLHGLEALTPSELRHEEEMDLKIIVDRIKKERHYQLSLPRMLIPLAALVLAIIFSLIWHFFAPHTIQTTGVEGLQAYFEKMRATTQQVYPNVAKKETTPRVPDSWVKSDPTKGMLSFFGLYSIIDELKAIRIVDPRDNSTRSIDILRQDESPDRVDPNFLRDVRPSNLGGVAVPFGSSPISIELDFKEQKHSEIQQVAMTNPSIECMNLVQTSVGKSGRAPALYAAYEPVDEEVVFLPIAPNNTVKILYALKNGSYQVFNRGDSRLWGIFQRAISPWKSSDTISLLFQGGDGRESGPFEYSLVGIEDMVRRSLKQQVLQRWREMVQCKRVAFKFPPPPTHDESEYSIKRKLISANLGFLEQAPVMVCIPSPSNDIGWSGHPAQSFGILWAVVREVRFGPEPSHLSYSATPDVDVRTFIETPRILVDAKWKVLMPANLQSVYAQFVFFDGKSTEPKSIPIEEVTP
jgi:hypothetical protein